MNKSANEVIDRLQVVLGAINDSELCKYLNLPRTNVSTWRGRNSVPYALCVDIAQEKNISLDWLLTGQGPMYRRPPEPQPAANDGPALSRRQLGMLELFDALDEKQQREILLAAEEKERLNKMAALLDDLLKKVG